MIGRTNVGGGAGLNFKVIGNPQPETAKDNTIWVDTDVKITGWNFNATQPETAEEGVVWISTDTSSPAAFNALKKNGIQVYPLSAKQYVNGAWVRKTAKIYQDGKWVAWSIPIFTNGQFKEITGFTCKYSTQHIADNCLVLTTDGNTHSIAYSNEKIDLTYASFIKVFLEPGTLSYHSPTPKFSVSNSIPSFNSTTGSVGELAASQEFINKDSGDFLRDYAGEYSLDVSKLSGSVYLVFNWCGTSRGNGVLKISDISVV